MRKLPKVLYSCLEIKWLFFVVARCAFAEKWTFLIFSMARTIILCTLVLYTSTHIIFWVLSCWYDVHCLPIALLIVFCGHLVLICLFICWLYGIIVIEVVEFLWDWFLNRGIFWLVNQELKKGFIWLYLFNFFNLYLHTVTKAYHLIQSLFPIS